MSRMDLTALLAARRTVVAGRADAALTGDRVLVLDVVSPDTVRRNNAEVLLFRGRHSRLLRSYRTYRHAAYVGVSTAALARALPWLLKHRLRGRLAFAGRGRLARHSPTWWVFAVTRRAPRTARRYLSADLGVEGLLSACIALRYVVLRWYETLPEIAPGEDLDLLVADEDLPALEAVLDSRPGTIACDVYTVTGLPGTDHEGMACYPPRLARRILDRAVLWHGARVPCPVDAFDSLAYHAVFHKGRLADDYHDYAAALAEKGAAVGLVPPGSVDGLADLLDARGWTPPLDTVARLGRRNPWAAARHAAAVARDEATCPGLAVFVVRETAAADVARVRDRLGAEGFTVLAVERLDPAARTRLTEAARGGNWGRGPYPRDGGPPAYVVVAVDVMPTPPSARTRAAWPGVDNERLLVKEEIRASLNAGLPVAEHRNAVHSSDNAAEALSYLRLALPRMAADLVGRARALRAAFDAREESTRDLTRNGRRARVEVVVDGVGPMVRKTFRPGCERFLDRERIAMTELAAASPHLLPLVAEGPEWVATRYVESTLRFDARHPRLLPLRVADAAIATAREVHALGYALVDFTPANLLVDRAGATYVVDYEFLHRYPSPPPLAESYDLAGPPPGFPGDLPVNPRGLGWAAAWQPYVGVPLPAMLAPTWRRHLTRTRYRLTVLWPTALRGWLALQGRRLRRKTLHRGRTNSARRSSVPA